MDFSLSGISAYLAVALIALSPVGEELVAIAAGVAWGLDPYTTALVALVSNWIPAPILILGGEYLAERWAFIKRWRKRSGTLQRWVDRTGILAVVIITPWIGIYATCLGGIFIGLKKYSLLGAATASLIIYAVASVLAAKGVLSFYKAFL